MPTATNNRDRKYGCTQRPPDGVAAPVGTALCLTCRGNGLDPDHSSTWGHVCPRCDGRGYVGLPHGPTNAQPGSALKAAYLRSRYLDGKPLWQTGDFTALRPDFLKAIEYPPEPAGEPDDDEFDDDDGPADAWLGV